MRPSAASRRHEETSASVFLPPSARRTSRGRIAWSLQPTRTARSRRRSSQRRQPRITSTPRRRRADVEVRGQPAVGHDQPAVAGVSRACSSHGAESLRAPRTSALDGSNAIPSASPLPEKRLPSAGESPFSRSGWRKAAAACQSAGGEHDDGRLDAALLLGVEVAGRRRARARPRARAAPGRWRVQRRTSAPCVSARAR